MNTVWYIITILAILLSIGTEVAHCKLVITNQVYHLLHSYQCAWHSITPLFYKNLLIIIIPTADYSTADVVICNSDSSSANTGLILSQFWFTMISMMEIHLWVLHRKLHQQMSGEHVKHTHICQLESTTDNQSNKTEYMNFNKTILQKNLLYHIGNFQDTLLLPHIKTLLKSNLRIY